MAPRRRCELWYDKVLNQQLLLDVPPRLAITLSFLAILVAGTITAYIGGGPIWFLLKRDRRLLPPAVDRRPPSSRAAGERLEEQLVDAITTLASGVRAGLNLVQAMELLARTCWPARSSRSLLAWLLREYQLGLDLQPGDAQHRQPHRLGHALPPALHRHRDAPPPRRRHRRELLDRIATSRVSSASTSASRASSTPSPPRAEPRPRWIAVMPLVFIGLPQLRRPRRRAAALHRTDRPPAASNT